MNSKDTTKQPVTVEQPPVSATSLVAITTEKSAMLALGMDMRNQINNQCTLIKALKIQDPQTLQIFKQKLTELNKLNIAIEKRRKEIKEPYLKTGKLIDTAANSLTEMLEQTIQWGKDEMIGYEKIHKAEADKLAQQAELEAANKIKEAQEKARLETMRIEHIAHCKNRYIEQLAGCTTMEELKDAFTGIVQDIGANSFRGEVSLELSGNEETVAFKNDIIRFKDQQKVNIQKIIDAQKAGDKKAELLAKQKAELQALEAEEKAKLEAEQKAKQVNASANETIEESQAAVIGTYAGLKPDLGQIRVSWDWELADFDAVPDSWKMVNIDEVKKYIKENSDKIKDGTIINGIRFKENRNPVLR